MSKKKSVNYKNLELNLIIILALITLFFWETVLVYPVKIFIVIIHEINHALMAVLTGGKVNSIFFAFDLSGFTSTSGGNVIFIAAAGYLGSLIFGALIYLSGENKKLRKWFTLCLSIIILIVAVNLVKGGLQIFLCIFVALIFYLVPKYLNDKINSILLKFIGLTSCLYVIVDIKQDLLTTTLRETDTQILEYLTGIPAIIIGMIWFGISIAALFMLVKRSYTSEKIDY